MSSEKLIPLETYPNALLAELDLGRLSQEGIAARIFDGNMGTYYAASGGVRLMVESKDLEAAKKILASERPQEQAAFDEAGEISEDSVYCFRCHSKDIDVESVEEAPGFLGRLFGQKPGWKKKVRCKNCGNEWRV